MIVLPVEGRGIMGTSEIVYLHIPSRTDRLRSKLTRPFKTGVRATCRPGEIMIGCHGVKSLGVGY